MNLSESQLKQEIAEFTELFEGISEERYDENLEHLIKAVHKILVLSSENDFTEIRRKASNLLGASFSERSLGAEADNRIAARKYLLDSISNDQSPIQPEQAADQLTEFAERCIENAKKIYEQTIDEQLKNRHAIFAHKRAIRHYRTAAQFYREAGNFEKYARIQFQIFACYNWIDNFRIVLGEEIPTNVEERITQALEARECFSNSPDSTELPEIEMMLGSLYSFRQTGSRRENKEIGGSFLRKALETDALKQDENFTVLQNLLSDPVDSGADKVLEALKEIYNDPLMFDSPELNHKWAEFLEGSFQITIDAYELEYRLALTEKAKHDALRGLTTKGFNFVLNQAFVLAQQNKSVEAVLFLEKWRGRQFADSLRLSPDNLSLVSEAERRNYLETTDRIRRLQAEERSRNKREAYQIYEDLRAAEIYFERIINQIRASQPDFLREPDFEEIRLAAAPDKPLIYLLTTEKGSLAIVVTTDAAPQSLWFYDFTQRDLSALLEFGERDFLPIEQISPPLQKLTGVLIRHLQEQSATGVYLILCGGLSLLPIGALVSESGCLLDSFDVHSAPTALALLAAQRRLAAAKKAENPPVENLLAIGDPRGDLIYSCSEVESISALFQSKGDARKLVGEDADPIKLGTALRENRPTHLHFACHGKFTAENPLDSALVLADGKTLDLRDILIDSDFAGIGAARLVTLSACRTAMIDSLRLPEESFGLPAGFLQTGAKGVIGTLWEVHDLSTTFLMIKFYENLLTESQPPAKALRSAQTWLRDATKNDLSRKYPTLVFRDGDLKTRDAYITLQNNLLEEQTPYRNPYFWAGFVLIGV